MKRQLRIVTGLIAMLSLFVGLAVVACAAEKHPNQVKSNDIGLDEEGNVVDLDLWEYNSEPIQMFALGDETEPDGVSIRYTGPTIDGRILGAIPATINGEITNLDGTFANRTDLIYPPELPASAPSMNNTFNGCSNLIAAPEIPQMVMSMNYTFADCIRMVTPPSAIPSTVMYMYGTFLNCSSMTYGPQLTNWPSKIDGFFSGCTSLNLDITEWPQVPYYVMITNPFSNVKDVRFLESDATMAQYALQNQSTFSGGPQKWTMIHHQKLGTIEIGETYQHTGHLGANIYYGYGLYVEEESVFFTPAENGDYRIVLSGTNMTAYFGEIGQPMDFLCYCSDAVDITRTLTAGKNYQVKIIGNYNTSNCSVQISSDAPPPETQEYIAGEEYSFAVKAENVTSFSNIVYKLEFDNTKFDIVNLCAGMYPAKTTTGTCSGQYITIQSIDSTGVTFKCTRMVPAGKAYTGVINVIKLKAKTTGEAEVKVTTTNA